jgi:iron complex transport system substrate-binding protein
MYATIFVKGRLKKSVAIGLGLGIALASLTGVSADAKAPKPFPVKIKTALGVVTIKSAPKAIISLSPTATEILFAIGAGKQVLAVDDQSNYPKSAPISKLSGFTPNLEAIAGMHPDLVVDGYDNIGGVVLSTGLAKFNVQTIEQPAADPLSDTYTQIVALGAATGHAKEASKLVISMKKRISAAIEKVGAMGYKFTFFHELDSTLYSATSTTFIGGVYSAFGLWNIADAANAADKSGYPQLSSEYVVASNPDVIFLADADYGQSLKTLKDRPGFSNLKAVKNHNIIPVSADITSRWGPRIADFYELIAKVIGKLAK